MTLPESCLGETSPSVLLPLSVSAVYLFLAVLFDPSGFYKHSLLYARMPLKRSSLDAGLGERSDHPKTAKRGRRERQDPSGDVVATREAQTRKRNRERQRRYRERQRSSANHALSPRQIENDGTGRVDAQPDTYLAAHQQLAIADFWERVRCFGTQLFECSTCKERYHGMRMKDSQCERCSNEVIHFLLCCSASLLRIFPPLLISATDIVLPMKTRQILETSHLNCMGT